METITILIALSVGLLVFGGICAWYINRNAKLASTLSDLETRKEACVILKSAIKHLEERGSGVNLEWSNARTILELAMHRVAFGDGDQVVI